MLVRNQRYRRLQPALRAAFAFPAGVMDMPPRPSLEADDLVTPGRGAALLDIPVNRLRVWINRSQDILGRKVKPLGTLGRWPAYDFNDLAALDAEMRRRQQQRDREAA